MKKRRSVLLGFLLAAVMFIGVGYAAVSQVLDITGTANVTTEQAAAEFDKDLYFSAVTTDPEGTSGKAYTARVNSDNDDKITFSVESLANLNDFVTFTVTVTNEFTTAAKLSVKSTTVGGANKEYFDIEVTWKNGNEIAAKDGETNGTLQFDVTVKLIKAPTTAVSAQFGLELDATTVN